MTETIYENFDNPIEAKELVNCADNYQLCTNDKVDGSSDSNYKGGKIVKSNDANKNAFNKSNQLQPNCPKENNSNTKPKITGDLCTKGKSQSPIDIKSNSVVKCSTTCDLSFFYKESNLQIRYDYKDLLINYDNGSYIMYNNDMYVLDKISFHPESNHKLDSYTFPLEINFNHKCPEKGKILIVAVLCEINEAQSKSKFFLDYLNKYLEKMVNNGASADFLKVDTSNKSNAYSILPEEKSFYTYSGSLTRPPCSEKVQWIIMENTVNISSKFNNNVKKLLQKIGKQNKPVLKSLNERVVYYNENKDDTNRYNDGNDLLCFTKKQFKEACPCMSDYQKSLNNEKKDLRINSTVIIITMMLFVISIITIIIILYLAKEGFFDDIIEYITKIFNAKTIEKSLEYMNDAINEGIDQIPKIESKDVGIS